MIQIAKQHRRLRLVGAGVVLIAVAAGWAAWQSAPRTWGVTPRAVACVLKQETDGPVYEWRSRGAGRALLALSRDGRWIRGVAFSSPASDGVPPIPLAWGPSAREHFDKGVNAFVAEVDEDWRKRSPDKTHQVVFRALRTWGDEVAGLLTAVDRQSRYEAPVPTVPPTSDCTRRHGASELRVVDWDRLPGRVSRHGTSSDFRTVEIGGAIVAWDGQGVAASALSCGASRWPKGLAPLLAKQGWSEGHRKQLVNGSTADSARPYVPVTAVGVTPESEIVTLEGPGRLPPSTLPADERLVDTIPEAWASWSHWHLVSAVAASANTGTAARCTQ